jgi:hypothetical protein
MRLLICVLGISALAWNASAAAQSTKVDLKTLPATIKSLDWKSVDWNATSQLDQARALSLLNHVLNEMGSQMAVEADLMSQYIDEQDLGEQCAAMPPVEDKHLTQEEAERVAVAMLRGPMAGSTFATMIADATPNDLKAYQQLYTSTCNREWASAVESRQQLKTMSHFLQTSGKLEGFKAWVPGEVERRKKEQAEEMARKRAALAEQEKQKKEERMQAAQERKEQEEKQRQADEQAALQMQQAMAAAQASQATEPAPAAYDDYPDWYYGGLGYAYGSWCRDDALRAVALSRTENRMTHWRAGGGGRGGGGGGRGGGRR